MGGSTKNAHKTILPSTVGRTGAPRGGGGGRGSRRAGVTTGLGVAGGAARASRTRPAGSLWKGPSSGKQMTQYRYCIGNINRLVIVGVGGVEAIDTAMKLGANHPMGPLELADFIGLDVCLSVMQVLYDGLADTKYRPCPLLVKYVEAGWLGRKTGRGFYDYGGETPIPTR